MMYDIGSRRRGGAPIISAVTAWRSQWGEWLVIVDQLYALLLNKYVWCAHTYTHAHTHTHTHTHTYIHTHIHTHTHTHITQTHTNTHTYTHTPNTVQMTV